MFDREVLPWIEGNSIVLEAHDDRLTRKIKGHLDTVLTIIRIAVPDDVGHDFLKDELTVVAGSPLEGLAVEGAPQVPERQLKSGARSRKGQNVTGWHRLGAEVRERISGRDRRNRLRLGGDNGHDLAQ